MQQPACSLEGPPTFLTVQAAHFRYFEYYGCMVVPETHIPRQPKSVFLYFAFSERCFLNKMNKS